MSFWGDRYKLPSDKTTGSDSLSKPPLDCVIVGFTIMMVDG